MNQPLNNKLKVDADVDQRLKIIGERFEVK